jgi:hypothetical protein
MTTTHRWVILILLLWIYRTMLDKFRILSLTECNRVLFMDGDVMARGSFDYLYHLSMSGTLGENVVVAGKTEPVNGGPSCSQDIPDHVGGGNTKSVPSAKCRLNWLDCFGVKLYDFPGKQLH